jgi:hypothetical protein
MDAKCAVKFLDEEKGIIEGLAIPYGGPVRNDIKELGKDLTGEYFSDKTDFTSPFYEGKSIKVTMPQLYHHGLDPDVKDLSIGEVKAIEDKPEGKWFTVQLDKSNKYYSALKELVKRGALLFSTGAIPEGVKKAADGFIEKWPLKENSLTPVPANPLAKVGSFKALTESVSASPAVPEGVDPAEWEMGMKEELEHRDVTGGDPMETAKIVTAHLKEDPKYYTKLKEAINKPEDKKAMEPEKKEETTTPAAKPEEEKKPETTETVEKAAKCNWKMSAMKDLGQAQEVPVPKELMRALIQLHEILEAVLPETAEETQEGAQGQPAGAPSQPGVGQGMSPENRQEDKSFDPEAMKALIKAAVEEATKPLKEQIKALEDAPASPGPVIKALANGIREAPNAKIGVESTDGNVKSVLDDLVKDTNLSPGTRTELGRRAALLSMHEIEKAAK